MDIPQQSGAYSAAIAPPLEFFSIEDALKRWDTGQHLWSPHLTGHCTYCCDMAVEANAQNAMMEVLRYLLAHNDEFLALCVTNGEPLDSTPARVAFFDRLIQDPKVVQAAMPVSYEDFGTVLDLAGTLYLSGYEATLRNTNMRERVVIVNRDARDAQKKKKMH